MSNTASKSADGLPLPTIAVTSGEPAGIGPDICLRLAERDVAGALVVLGDGELLVARAAQLGLDAGGIEIRHIPLKKSALAGRLDPANARYVLDLLDAALAGCVAGEYRGDGHGPGAQGRHQRCRHPFQRPYRIPGRAHRHAARGDDAGRRRTCASRWPPRTCR
jgi:4-hydroxy-L-threonine phosphate dehydrogenase PdxA